MQEIKKEAPFKLMLVAPLSGGRHFDLYPLVKLALQGGVQAVQLRDKEAPPQAMMEAGRRLAEIIHRYNGLLFINSFVDVALNCRADGVHLVSQGVDYSAVKERVAGRLLIGASTHNLEEVQTVQQAGLDYAIIGPVYWTPSKSGRGAPLGLEYLAKICAQTDIPLIAIGGITPERVMQVLKSGAKGVAVMGYILNSPQPQESAGALKKELKA